MVILIVRHADLIIQAMGLAKGKPTEMPGEDEQPWKELRVERGAWRMSTGSGATAPAKDSVLFDMPRGIGASNRFKPLSVKGLDR